MNLLKLLDPVTYRLHSLSSGSLADSFNELGTLFNADGGFTLTTRKGAKVVLSVYCPDKGPDYVTWGDVLLGVPEGKQAGLVARAKELGGHYLRPLLVVSWFDGEVSPRCLLVDSICDAADCWIVLNEADHPKHNHHDYQAVVTAVVQGCYALDRLVIEAKGGQS